MPRDGRRRQMVWLDDGATRVSDVLVSAVALVILSPVLLVIAALVRLDSAGPALYRALRVGRDGRPFYLLKFRSMMVGADRGASITGAGDRRVTRLGRRLRASRLDELPQLVNVLRGDMSLVGPRPETPAIVRHYSVEQLSVLRVRPGMTGPTQLRFHDEAKLLTEPDTEAQYIREVLPAKLDSDLAYIRDRSFTGDLAVLLATARLLARSSAGERGGT